MKKILFTAFVSTVLSTALFAGKITKDECKAKGQNFIFAGNECIEYKKFKGEMDNKLIVVVHGSWKEGTNILARYAPFAENLSMQTDITTVAVALPGYSGSSTNNFPSLLNEQGIKNLSAKKEYLNFLVSLLEGLKEKFEVSEIIYVGHSAGCAMGATILGYKPNLITNILCAGGSYDIHKKDSDKSLISAVDFVDNIPKDTKIALVYGTQDDVSKPEVTKEFYELIKQKGFEAELVEVEGAPHIDLDMTNPSVDALVKLVEEE